MLKLNNKVGPWWKTLTAKALDRLTGFPVITIRYRADWRILADAHTSILALIEDSKTGEQARRAAEIWLRQNARGARRARGQIDD